MNRPQLYLASQSPRRAELLRQLGLDFEFVVAPVDESVHAGETPVDYVRRVAREKAAAAAAKIRHPANAVLLAADTSVVVDDEVLGKPADRQQCLDMLARLAGRSHLVMSAVALWTPAGVDEALSISEVWFRDIAPEEAAAYWDTGEPSDKAGGYAIQGRAALFVERLAGSYSGVVGLPLFETAQLLQRHGVHVLRREVE
jgi:septum formation protein